MGYLNKVMLIGNLGKDPEKRLTNSGSTVSTLSLATTEKYKDASGNLQEKTEWHRVVLWNRLADIAEQFLKKGSSIYVEGRLRTNEWQDKDGNKRYTTEIVASSFQFLDRANRSEGTSNYATTPNFQQNQNFNNTPPQNSFNPAVSQGTNSPQFSNVPPQEDFIEDDVPF